MPETFTKKYRLYIRSISHKYIEHDGKLYRKSIFPNIPRRVLRRNEIKEVMEAYHDHHLAGHGGVKSTFEKISKKYYWPKYHDTIRRWVLNCQKCQLHTPTSKRKKEMLHPLPLPLGPFDEIEVDFTHMPKSPRNTNRIIVAVDRLTGWVEAEACSTESAIIFAGFIYRIICRHGSIGVIRTNNGSPFRSAIAEELSESYNIVQRFAAPYHPESSGLVEKRNQDIKRVLKKLGDWRENNWDLYLESALFAIRTIPNKNNNYCYSPFFLLYGRDPRLPVDYQILEELLEYDIVTNEDYEDAILYRMSQLDNLTSTAINDARNKNKITQEEYRQKYQKKFNIDPTFKYAIGDKVYIEETRIKNTNMSTMQPCWTGPYTIAKILKGNTYILEDNGIKLKLPIHSDRLKIVSSNIRRSNND